MNYSNVTRAVYDAAIPVAKELGLHYRVLSTIRNDTIPKPPWCDIVVRMAEASVKEIGDGPHARRNGILYVSVFDGRSSTEGKMLEIVDKFNDYIELSTHGVIEFGCSTVGEQEEDLSGFHRCVISFPFRTN